MKAASNPWAKYTSWLKENAPDAFANLAPPASAKELAALEGGDCESLILTKGRSLQGPHSIAFQYERGKDGVWRGGYAVETRRPTPKKRPTNKVMVFYCR